MPGILLLLLLFATPGFAQSSADAQSQTLIGPRNPALYDGAQALLAGDIEEGIRLTRIGLAAAVGRRERQAGLSNLCAAYVLLERFDEALAWCNQALSEHDRNWRALSNRALVFVKTGRYDEARADLDRGQEISPGARSLREVRGMLLDATEPVEESIVIDDRRDSGDDDE